MSSSNNASNSHETIGISPSIVILLFGLVSLAGDMTYEAGRGIIPSYLEFLGFTALYVGTILGVAEFLGYVVRVIAGPLTDTTKAYWTFILMGYGSLIVIPLLGLVKSWQVAVLLIFIERIGKGIRSPARDSVLSMLTQKVGTGKAFGIHEFFDQLGAVSGPLIVTFTLYYTNDYSVAFLVLIIPYIVLFALINYLYQKTKQATATTIKQQSSQAEENLTLSFWVYNASILFNTVGLFPVSLILYVSTGLFPVWQVPLIYVLVQAVDAITALLAGFLFDKYGFLILSVVFAFSIFPGILIFSYSKIAILAAAITFGLVLGAQESIYRARIADFTPLKKRGTAYGIFHTFYAIGLLLSGMIFGFFLDHSVANSLLITYVVSLQFIAIVLLFLSKKLT